MILPIRRQSLLVRRVRCLSAVPATTAGCCLPRPLSDESPDTRGWYRTKVRDRSLPRGLSRPLGVDPTIPSLESSRIGRHSSSQPRSDGCLLCVAGIDTDGSRSVFPPDNCPDLQLSICWSVDGDSRRAGWKGSSGSSSHSCTIPWRGGFFARIRPHGFNSAIPYLNAPFI